MSRDVNARIAWFRQHRPTAVGMCLRHTWEATDLPQLGLPDANAGAAYVKGAGELKPKSGKPPRGAWVWYTSPTHGHVALSLGDGHIVSTDVHGPATTGTVPITWPVTQWGHKYVGWSDWYGETFQVGNGDNMPLSNEDLDKIAERVWRYELVQNSSTNAQSKRPAHWFVTRILEKVKDLK